jgi:tetratricopeptide (TPR) repeat protein
MKTNRHYLLILASLGITHAGLGKIELVQHAPSEKEQYYFLALAGAHEHLAGRYQQAQETYTHLHKATPHDHALMSAAIRLAFDHQHFTAVTAYADKIDPSHSRDKDLAFLIAQAYLFLHKDTEGIALLEKLRALYPNDDLFDYFAAMTYIKKAQHQEALDIIAKVLADPTKRSRYYLFHFLKAKYFFTHEQFDEALEEVTASLINNPSFAQGFFLKGAILEQKLEYKRALAAYQRYQAINRSDTTIAKKIEDLRERIANQSERVMPVIELSS